MMPEPEHVNPPDAQPLLSDAALYESPALVECVLRWAAPYMGGFFASCGPIADGDDEAAARAWDYAVSDLLETCTTRSDEQQQS